MMALKDGSQIQIRFCWAMACSVEAKVVDQCLGNQMHATVLDVNVGRGITQPSGLQLLWIGPFGSVFYIISEWFDDPVVVLSQQPSDCNQVSW